MLEFLTLLNAGAGLKLAMKAPDFKSWSRV